IRDVGEVLVQQAEERIGTEMFASFWHHSRHRNPQHDVIHERHHSHESRIVAFMFTKSQLEGWRDYWDLLTSGNCWRRLRFRRSTKAVLICQPQAVSTCCTASNVPKTTR